MENVLFRVFDKEELREDKSECPGLRYCGYGSSQKAFTVMAYGYKDAAEQLADSQCDLSEKYNDGLLYPIMFCYRQSVELMLKASFLNLYLRKDKQLHTSERIALGKLIKTHKLSAILSDIGNSLNQIHCTGLDDLIAKIAIYISAIEEIDSESFVMRYPADKDMNADKIHASIHGFDVQYTKEQFPEFWSLLQDLYSKTENLWSRGTLE